MLDQPRTRCPSRAGRRCRRSPRRAGVGHRQVDRAPARRARASPRWSAPPARCGRRPARWWPAARRGRRRTVNDTSAPAARKLLDERRQVARRRAAVRPALGRPRRVDRSRPTVARTSSQALAAQPLGLGQRARGPAGVVLDRQPGAGHVQQRHGEAVRDDVVQLAGDPVALLGPGPLGQAGLGRAQLLHQSRWRRASRQPTMAKVRAGDPGPPARVVLAHSSHSTPNTSRRAGPEDDGRRGRPPTSDAPAPTSASARTSRRLAGPAVPEDGDRARGRHRRRPAPGARRHRNSAAPRRRPPRPAPRGPAAVPGQPDHRPMTTNAANAPRPTRPDRRVTLARPACGRRRHAADPRRSQSRRRQVHSAAAGARSDRPPPGRCEHRQTRHHDQRPVAVPDAQPRLADRVGHQGQRQQVGDVAQRRRPSPPAAGRRRRAGTTGRTASGRPPGPPGRDGSSVPSSTPDADEGRPSRARTPAATRAGLVQRRDAVDRRGDREQHGEPATRSRQADRELGQREGPAREAGGGEPAQHAALAVGRQVDRHHDQAGGGDDDGEVGRDVPVGRVRRRRTRRRRRCRTTRR